MSKSNLIPQSKRTKAEQREIAKKGGQASGESRRKKKSMRELLIWYLDQPDPDTGESNRASIAAALLKQCLDGNIRAINLLLELIGESPTKHVNMTSSDGSLQKLSVNLSASPAVQDFIARLKILDRKQT